MIYDIRQVIFFPKNSISDCHRSIYSICVMLNKNFLVSAFYFDITILIFVILLYLIYYVFHCTHTYVHMYIYSTYIYIYSSVSPN